MKEQNKPLWHLFIVLLLCSTNSATAQTVPEIAEKALASTVTYTIEGVTAKECSVCSARFPKS